jgi:putative transposase
VWARRRGCLGERACHGEAERLIPAEPAGKEHYKAEPCNEGTGKAEPAGKEHFKAEPCNEGTGKAEPCNEGTGKAEPCNEGLSAGGVVHLPDLVSRLRLDTHFTRRLRRFDFWNLPMTRSRYRIFDGETPHFLTATIVAWLPVFSQPAFAEIILGSWRFQQRERGLQIYGYVIMENHIHWIASAPALSDLIRQFKSFTARQILDAMERRGYVTMLSQLRYFKAPIKVDQDFQFWQEGNHPEEIQNDEMMDQKLDYMHLNPVRRGYVDDPVDWRYSSARNYAGMEGLLDVITDWR